MNTPPTDTTATRHAAPVRSSPYRHAKRLEELVRRVRLEEFSSQNAIATVYGTNTGTVSRWKNRAIVRGLVTAREWKHALLKGKLRELEQ